MKIFYQMIFYIFLFVFSLNAQTINLHKLIKQSEGARINYSKVFKDLSSEELKTKIFYRSNGSIRDQRIIKSLFIVYESPFTRKINEFRNVLELNGKNVARNDDQLTKFFEKIEKTNSDKKLEENLLKESMRFDGDKYSWGITLSQISPFYEFMQDSFKYRIIGEEEVNNRKVVIIEYNQIKYSQYIQVNPTSEEQKQDDYFTSWTKIPNDFSPTNPRMSGRVWLDVETGQIRKNEFQIRINPKKVGKDFVVIEDVYEYQDSDFGILVPKEFTTTTFEIKGNNEANFTVIKSLESKFEYSNFTKITSEINKYEVGK